MAKLIFEDTQEEIELEDNSEIQDVCEEQGVPIACSEGICGACIINVTEGMENLSPITEEEKDFFGEEPTCERLACQCKIKKGKVKIKT